MLLGLPQLNVKRVKKLTGNAGNKTTPSGFPHRYSGYKLTKSLLLHSAQTSWRADPVLSPSLSFPNTITGQFHSSVLTD